MYIIIKRNKTNYIKYISFISSNSVHLIHYYMGSLQSMQYQHYMEHHRDTHMFPCWECDKKFKTIEELKTHFAKQHFDKKTTRDYSSFYA